MFFASLTGLIYPETAQRNDRVLNDIEQTAERATPRALLLERISLHTAN
jgi:hypothetical protein